MFEKVEGVAGKLTEGSIRAEEGQERGLDGEGEAPARLAQAAGDLDADLAGERLERHEMGWRRWTARLCSSGRGKSRRGGEEWSAQSSAAALLELGSTHARGRRKRRMNG